MDRRELAALTDFVLTVVWPSRTFTVVNNPAGQSVFPVRGTWNTTHDLPMVWVNGNRLVGTATLTAASQVTISPAAPNGAQVIVLVHPGSGSGYLPRNPAGASMLGALSMGNQRITDLAASVNPNDAVRRADVEAIVNTLIGANYVLRAGSTMTGPLVLPAPVAWTDEGGDANGTPLEAAARRNEVVRKAHTGTQTVVGKLATAATVDEDPDVTLTTKGWVTSRVSSTPTARLRRPNVSLATNSDFVDMNLYDHTMTMWIYAGDGFMPTMERLPNEAYRLKVVYHEDGGDNFTYAEPTGPLLPVGDKIEYFGMMRPYAKAYTQTNIHTFGSHVEMSNERISIVRYNYSGIGYNNAVYHHWAPAFFEIEPGRIYVGGVHSRTANINGEPTLQLTDTPADNQWRALFALSYLAGTVNLLFKIAPAETFTMHGLSLRRYAVSIKRQHDAGGAYHTVSNNYHVGITESDFITYVG